MTPKQDLIVLAADLSMKLAVTEVLKRHRSLKIREISCLVLQQPNYDSGVFKSGPEVLQAQARHYHYAIAICDRHGCGRDARPRAEIEKLLEARMASHWNDRAAAIVIDPELENWVWTDSPHVADAIGWQGGMPELRMWLRNREYVAEGHSKPSKPKEALEEALRITKNRRSSSLYQSLAGKVTLSGCADPAFLKLYATLRDWFPAQP